MLEYLDATRNERGQPNENIHRTPDSKWQVLCRVGGEGVWGRIPSPPGSHAKPSFELAEA